MDIISSMARNLRDGALTRYEHFEKIKGKLQLKNCMLLGRIKKDLHACSMHIL
jgi:hypothetical protein